MKQNLREGDFRPPVVKPPTITVCTGIEWYANDFIAEEHDISFYGIQGLIIFESTSLLILNDISHAFSIVPSPSISPSYLPYDYPLWSLDWSRASDGSATIACSPLSPSKHSLSFRECYRLFSSPSPCPECLGCPSPFVLPWPNYLPCFYCPDFWCPRVSWRMECSLFGFGSRLGCSLVGVDSSLRLLTSLAFRI